MSMTDEIDAMLDEYADELHKFTVLPFSLREKLYKDDRSLGLKMFGVGMSIMKKTGLHYDHSKIKRQFSCRHGAMLVGLAQKFIADVQDQCIEAGYIDLNERRKRYNSGQ